MKQYKHIPTGAIAHEEAHVYRIVGGYLDDMEIHKLVVEHKSNKDWELIKNYTILTFKNLNTYDKKGLWNLQSDGTYKWRNGGSIVTLKQLLNTPDSNVINSVRRESDGEIFTVGDNTIHGTIKRFFIGDADNMFFDSDKMLAGKFNHPSFIRLTPKEWEITAIRNKINNKIRYVVADQIGEKPSIDYEIYSVKRLSDGVEFKIGDKFYWNKHTSYVQEILSFRIDKDNIYICNKSWADTNVMEAVKVKEKLFITEDGVDIYEGDKYTWVNGNLQMTGINIPASYSYDFETGEKCNDFDNTTDRKNGHRYFSTKEAAEEYILMNKPLISLNDINENWVIKNTDGVTHVHGSRTFERLKKLAKSKL